MRRRWIATVPLSGLLLVLFVLARAFTRRGDQRELEVMPVHAPGGESRDRRAAPPRVGAYAMAMDKPHRCVVLVHGIGSQARGSFLVGAGEPLTAFIREHLTDGTGVDVHTDLSPRGSTGATSVVCFRDKVGKEQVLCLREAWWAERFSPPAYATVLHWAFGQWHRQTAAITRTVLRGMLEPGWTAGQMAEGQSVETPTDMAIYASPPRTATAYVYDVLAGVIIVVFMTLGAPLVMLLLLVVWILQSVPALAALGVGTRLLEGVAVSHLGDVYVYFRTEQIRASIRSAVEDALRPSLAPPHCAHCGGVTVIADSLGAVVALDSLLHLGDELAATDAAGQRPPECPVTLVTVGAALNGAWRVNQADRIWERIKRGALPSWLEKLRWVNIWTRYDPVPGGGLDEPLVALLTPVFGRPFDRRVVNVDNILTDHTTYYANLPEVQSRLAYEALGRPEYPTLPPGTAHPIVEYVGKPLRRRRCWVGILAGSRFALILLALVLALLPLPGWLRDAGKNPQPPEVVARFALARDVAARLRDWPAFPERAVVEGLAGGMAVLNLAALALLAVVASALARWGSMPVFLRQTLAKLAVALGVGIIVFFLPLLVALLVLLLPEGSSRWAASAIAWALCAAVVITTFIQGWTCFSKIFALMLTALSAWAGVAYLAGTSPTTRTIISFGLLAAIYRLGAAWFAEQVESDLRTGVTVTASGGVSA